MSEQQDYVVRLNGVSMSYGKVQALRNLSLQIPARTFVGLIGPDGVGKSSMLSLVTGAHAMPEEGELTVLGGDMRSKAHRDLVCPKIAYMPQGLGKNLYFTLTVEENLQFFAGLFGHNQAEARKRIDRLTKSTGLYRFLNRPAGKLSGGMKQKLGLCCSLIHDPDLLVLDEPTTGVDPLARRQFWDLVDNVRIQQPQMSVIVATAYMDEAQRFDWLVAMDDGQVLATGTPKELLERTGQPNLDAAFIKLLPEEKQAGHKDLIVPPLEIPSDTTGYSIEANGLTKRFGDFTAVDHVSFQIRRGEIFGFLGSNGCGKTTTMRMLTGLLTPTEGEAKLFGQKLDAENLETRLHIGYMTQLFSLYNELTVYQNLQLYARLCRIPEKEIAERIEGMINRFGLNEIRNTTPESLPLGMKQRLSLAAAAIHNPDILILDEPTSGVDPVARDSFWELIIELSRRDHVTIFITTHFMNEAERCDRISLMHAGRSLACDAPQKLVEERKAKTLEEAFIGYLEDADPVSAASDKLENAEPEPVKEVKPKTGLAKFFDKYFNLKRVATCCWRETLELMRDPIRMTLATFGAVILMLVMGYGITLDVEDLKFAVYDEDQSLTSIHYAQNITGSIYFKEMPPVHSLDEMENRLREGDVSLVVQIPMNFGKDVQRGACPQVAYWIDGADPGRAETIVGYVEGIHSLWLNEQNQRANGASAGLFDLETRNRYNPDVKSLPAMVPCVMPLLLLMIPAILAALAIVREKEMGSIINLYVTPLSRGEFMIGKQLPYIFFSMISFVILLLMSVFLFKVPIKGSTATLFLALFLYTIITTGMGLLASSVTKSQIAVIFLTMIGTMLPAEQYCGLINPVSSLQGGGRLIGELYPTSHMFTISRGIFNKALEFGDLTSPIMKLLITIPILLTICILLQKKQES